TSSSAISTVRGTIRKSSYRWSVMALPPSGRSPSFARSVLLVDGDADTCALYSEYLRLHGFSVDQVQDGRQALAKAITQPADVVVTETRLPGIDGYRLMELLRSDRETSTLPIIVVTGEADVARAHAAGADVVFVKPCVPEMLLEAIDH